MDEELLFLINRQWTHPALDKFMAVVTDSAFWTPMMVLAVIAVLIWGGFHARAMLVCLGLAIAVNDGLLVNLLKDTVERPRPHKTHEEVRLIELERAEPKFLALFLPLRIKYSSPRLDSPEGRSFPSGHAVNNFTLATVLAVFYRFGWLYFFPALLVAYSRIYNGSHWPSDVLLSIPLAIGGALLTLALIEWLWHKYGGRLLPQLRARYPSLCHSR